MIPAPWPHQRDAIDWIVARSSSYLHLTMGAGKSRCVVTAADECGARKVLIVAPKSVVASVWPGQFSQWSEQPWRLAPATALGKSVAARMKGIRTVWDRALYDRAPVVVVINYQMLLSRVAMDFLKQCGWDMVVFDEAQKLKAPTGKTSRAAKTLTAKAQRVVMLSGTPMPHSPLDVFGQFRALDPTVFGGSWIAFRARYASMGGYQGKQVIGYRNQAEMTERMSDLMFSPSADAVQLNLPEATHQIVPVTLSARARSLYDALRGELVAACDEGTINASNALVRLLRMQQLCSGLAVVETEAEADMTDEQMIARLFSSAADDRKELEVCTAKLDALEDLLGATDEPVVVFGQFRRDMDLARAAADKVGGGYAELSGHHNNLDAWQHGQARVLGVQIASGAEGIDLTRARICVYVSTGFNLGTYLQSLARVHRPGQTRPVHYYHLHAADTVDQTVYRVLQRREDLVAGVLAEVRQPSPAT